MKIFTIENETNEITVHATIQDAEAVANAETFRNESGLNKLAADWPAARLVEIWNSLPGVSPVKKFKDRPTAVSRIWKALESLGQVAPAADKVLPAEEAAAFPEANETTEPAAAIPQEPEPATATPVAPQTPDVTQEEAPSPKKTTSRKNGPKAPEAAAKAPRESSKTAQVVAMLQRPEGATLSEIMTSMGWQKHTVRGCMAGPMKKAGFTVESFKSESGNVPTASTNSFSDLPMPARLLLRRAFLRSGLVLAR
jgi:hypothetical protein